jgi:hypothetical protein
LRRGLVHERGDKDRDERRTKAGRYTDIAVSVWCRADMVFLKLRDALTGLRTFGDPR